MDRMLLLDAVRQLEQLGAGTGTYARAQAVRQFNSLLQEAKDQFAGRHDVQALEPFQRVEIVDRIVFLDAVERLRASLELRPSVAAAAFLADVVLPDNLAPGLARDVAELREAANIGLAKTTLLLSGVVAEALLLTRHPDTSDRGPGLGELVAQATSQKLFGSDLLGHLNRLVGYRDLIHPRAQVRNRIEPNDARIEAALAALRLLCQNLEDDPNLRFT